MTRSKTLPVLQQTDTHVQDARKGADAQGFDDAEKRARHVNREIIHVSDNPPQSVDRLKCLPQIVLRNLASEHDAGDG